MAAKKLGLLIVFLIVHSISYAQKHSGTIAEFVDVAGSGNGISGDIKKDCKWYYVLVKVNCDRSNRVISYQILNEVPEHIKAHFKGMEGFHIKDKRTLQRRPILFCMGFENMDNDCILNDKTIAAEGAMEIYTLVAKELQKNPKAIVSESCSYYKYNESPNYKESF